MFSEESWIAITWEGSLSQNSRRGLCEGWSLAARIPEVTERKQWYLIMGGRIKDMKYVHLVPNDDTAPVNIGWGFLSHIPHAPQLVQTCPVNESSLRKGVKRNLCHDPPAEISLRASWLESAPVHSRLILGKALYVMISRCLLCLYIFTQPMPVCHHSQLGSLQQYQCNWKRP